MVPPIITSASAKSVSLALGLSILILSTKFLRKVQLLWVHCFNNLIAKRKDKVLGYLYPSQAPYSSSIFVLTLQSWERVFLYLKQISQTEHKYEPQIEISVSDNFT